jgi:hypothetical protein
VHAKPSTHPVALVLAEAVLRVLLLQLLHHAVTCDLQDSTARHSTPQHATQHAEDVTHPLAALLPRCSPYTRAGPPSAQRTVAQQTTGQ